MNSMNCAIRELQARDIYLLNKMYDSLSDKSKLFLHSGYLGFESVGSSWFQVNIALFLSSINALRNVLKRLCPYLVFLTLIVVDASGSAIAFAFIKLKGRTRGELVICVKDGYQRMGLGSRLMQATIDVARAESVKFLFLSVLKVNVNAIHFFRKFGFKGIRIVREGVYWRGRRFDNVEMSLDITELNSVHEMVNAKEKE